MTTVNIIDAMGRLVIILIVGSLLFILRKPLMGMLARRGTKVSWLGVTIEVGDQEIPLQNATDELRSNLTDLQNKLTNLLKWQADFVKQIPKAKQTAGEAAKPIADLTPIIDQRPKELLWVDDEPAKNASVIAELHRQNVEVVQASSTSEALRLIQEEWPFDAIITDMVRIEQRRTRMRAGMDLSRKVRKLHADLPIILFSPTDTQADALKEAGVSFATRSPIELLAALQITPGQAPNR